ncbi:MAG: hypothetical protein WA705_19460 [Candidatus Ozemobacteraceae bacterium]
MAIPSGTSDLGLYVTLKDPTTGSYQWGDFKRIKIERTVLPPATGAIELSGISLNPASASVNTGETYDLANVTVTASYDNASNTASSSAVVTSVTWSGEGVSVGGTIFTAPTSSASGSERVSLTCGYTEGGVTKTALFIVTVTVAASPAKAITAFDFETLAGPGPGTGTVTVTVIGVVNEGSHTVALTVPFGTNVTALTPIIKHTGASVSPNSGVAQDFSTPATYTVTAADTTTQEYVVTVTVAANPAKAITAFDFGTASGTIIGAVNEGSHTVALTVPFETNLTALTPIITHTGASVSPNSGVAQDFSTPATYTVTAADTTTQEYVVTVAVAANPAKAITAFDFGNPAGPVIGVINEGSHTVSLTVPFGTNVTALTPTVTHTGASVSPNSGVAQDFTTPATYTVTAADTTIQEYLVTVTVAPAVSAPTNTAQTLKSGDVTTSTVQSTKVGSIYLVKTGEAATTQAEINTAVAANKAFLGKSSATANTPYTATLTANLVDGLYDLVAVDTVGNVSAIVGGWLTVDNTAPVVSAPTSVAQTLKSGDVTTSTVQSTEAGNIYLVKTGEAATTQAEINTAVAADKAFLGKSNAAANTPYTATLTASLADGLYDLVAVDTVGNVSAVVGGWLTVDNTAPVVSAPTSVAQTLKSADGTTSTVQSTKAGNIYFVKAGEAATTQAEINTAVAANKAFLGKSSATGNTPYTATLTAGLVDGLYDLVAVDTVGNVSAVVGGWLTVDNTAPVVSAPTSVAQTLKSGDVTTSTVQSTEAGNIYLVKTGEAATTQAEINTAITANMAFLGQNNATANTSYTVTLAAGLVDGLYDLVAVDTVGNVSAVVGGWLTVDNTAPVVSAPTSTAETLMNGDMTTSTVQTTEAGNIYFVRDTESVSTQAGIDVAIASHNTFLAKNNAAAGTPYAVTLAAGLNSGVYNLVAVDAVGNVSTSVSGWLTVDNSASGTDGADVAIDEGGISSVYVRIPRTVLPDATVVPSFLCGKYPATAGAANAAGATYTYEATYQVGGDGSLRQAATTAAGRPWVYIDWNNAKIACTQAGGSLIGENQWLAIANNAIGVTANWRNGTIGSTEAAGGGFYRGLSNSTVTKGQPATGGDTGFDPANTSVEYRVKALTNGAQVWDIGGNVYQWVDQLQAANTWYTGYSTTSGWIETNLAGITTTKIKTVYDASYGVGRIFNYSTTYDLAFLRGGYWSNSDNVGAFCLYLIIGPPSALNRVGFRCTRP